MVKHAYAVMLWVTSIMSLVCSIWLLWYVLAYWPWVAAGLNIARMLGDKFLKEQDARFSPEPYVSQVVHIPKGRKAFALLARWSFFYDLSFLPTITEMKFCSNFVLYCFFIDVVMGYGMLSVSRKLCSLSFRYDTCLEHFAGCIREIFVFYIDNLLCH